MTTNTLIMAITTVTSDEYNLNLPELTEEDMKKDEYTLSFGHTMSKDTKYLMDSVSLITFSHVIEEIVKPDRKTFILFFTPPTIENQDRSVKEQMDFMVSLFRHRDDVIIKRSIDQFNHYCLVFIDKKKL